MAISGIQLYNWANGDKTPILLHELMAIESIIEKMMKGKNTTAFKGRVFYAIIP